MTITPIIPSPTRLDGDLDRADEILARARTAVRIAGEGAQAFSRVSITVYSAEAVDAIAAEWGTTARWRAGGTQYVTEYGYLAEAEAEAVYFRPAESAAAA
jgi:hypothetical protein